MKAKVNNLITRYENKRGALKRDMRMSSINESLLIGAHIDAIDEFLSDLRKLKG